MVPPVSAIVVIVGGVPEGSSLSYRMPTSTTVIISPEFNPESVVVYKS